MMADPLRQGSERPRTGQPVHEAWAPEASAPPVGLAPVRTDLHQRPLTAAALPGAPAANALLSETEMGMLQSFFGHIQGDSAAVAPFSGPVARPQLVQPGRAATPWNQVPPATISPAATALVTAAPPPQAAPQTTPSPPSGSTSPTADSIALSSGQHVSMDALVWQLRTIDRNVSAILSGSVRSKRSYTRRGRDATLGDVESPVGPPPSLLLGDGAHSPVDDGSGRSAGGRVGKSGKLLLSDETKRLNHIESEKNRRLNIRIGFDQLAALVPSLAQEHTAGAGSGSCSLSTQRSEALILEKTIAYLFYCQRVRRHLHHRITRLRSILGEYAWKQRSGSDPAIAAVLSRPLPLPPAAEDRLYARGLLADHFESVDLALQQLQSG